MANINSTSLRNNLVQSLTMSGNLTWAKADFKGKFTVFISATGSTRTLTISDTGFVAGDFLCLLIDQNSAQNVSVTIGTRNIANNRGNIINALFDGTNWHVWSGGGVFNTSSSVFTRNSNGLSSRATNSLASAYGYNSDAANGGTATGANSTTTGSDGTATGKNSNAGSNSTATGNAASVGIEQSNGVGNSISITGQFSNGMGAFAVLNASTTTSIGHYNNMNSFVRSVLVGAYARSRRYGSTRFHLGITTSSTDATNPTQNKEWSTWNGTTANDTITEIFLRGVASNRCVLQAKNAISFKGQAVAFLSNYTGSARWDIEGLIKRDGSNNTTLVGVTTTLTHSDGTGNTLVLTIDADDTNESLRVQVTGNASETWTWLVELELLDLRIA